MVGSLFLALALDACAPEVDPASFAPQIYVESSLDPHVIHDNAYGHSYYHLSLDEAVALSRRFMADGPYSERCRYARQAGSSCTIDVGIAQINESNFAHYGVSADNIAALFDVRQNLEVGADMMHHAWVTAVDVSEHNPSVWAREVSLWGDLEPRQVMLRSAFSIYNSNSAFGSPSYVESIVAAANYPAVRQIIALAAEHRGEPRSCMSLNFGGGDAD